MLDFSKLNKNELIWNAKKVGWRAFEVGAAAGMYLWGWFFPDPVIIGQISGSRAPLRKKATPAP